MDADNQPFPPTHSTTTHYTTTSVHTATISTGGRPYFDPFYMRSLPGIVKLIQLVLGFVCFICIIAGPAYSGAGWGVFVSIVGFLITLTLLMLYIFHVVEAINRVPWTVGEMVYCFVWTIFFFIASCVLAVAASTFYQAGAFGFAAFFGFAAMLAYMFDCYLKFRDWRNGNPAQGPIP